MEEIAFILFSVEITFVLAKGIHVERPDKFAYARTGVDIENILERAVVVYHFLCIFHTLLHMHFSHFRKMVVVHLVFVIVNVKHCNGRDRIVGHVGFLIRAILVAQPMRVARRKKIANGNEGLG